MNSVFLGIDTGGTFTDFVLWSADQLRVHKVLSTPQAPERAIMQGIEDLGLSLDDLKVVHGSTVATNAVLEGKGVATLFVTNRGFADMLTLGRQNRRELYNLQPQKIAPPVPADFCVETGGRLSASGEWIEPLLEEDLHHLLRVIETKRPAAVAVNLLFSWLDDRAEQAIAEALPDELFVSLSSQVLPQLREYERGMATWLNAWVGPLVQGYLQRLRARMPHTQVAVMQSSGDTLAAEQAGRNAVRMLLSGPAGGLVAARFVAGQRGMSRLLTFDMGGTSTDVALIDGEQKLTSEGRIGNYPVAVPMVDMHTIGAGGGSIAWLDDGGMLQVGPESAGADPGPVCYGQGGLRPTVTDANLLLGRLLPDRFLGGAMKLDVEAARRSMKVLARKMGGTAMEAALGVIRIANEHMARALRSISIQRGEDPQRLVLVSFGGAGGLHVCALAAALGMSQALVPVHGGVLSALGMLAARPGRQLARSWLAPLAELQNGDVEAGLRQLAATGLAELAQEGVCPDDCEQHPSLDVRYCGQSSTLEIPWTDLEQVAEAFHVAHQRRFGHRLDLPLEVVNLRQSLRGPRQPLRLQPWAQTTPAAPSWQSVVGQDAPVPVYARAALARGQQIEGPAIITETTATTWLESGWRCTVDEWGNLLLQRQQTGPTCRDNEC